MIEYEKRAMIEAEDKYTFRQSTQISMQTGLIGHLRADMDTDGNGFFSSWFDFREELKTDEFKAEFDDVINSLREEGDILHITLRWFDAISAVPLPYCLICQQTTVSVLDELNLSVVYQFAEFIDADAAVLTHLLNRFKHGDDLRLMNGLLSSCHSQSSFIYLPRYNRIPAAHCSRCRCP